MRDFQSTQRLNVLDFGHSTTNVPNDILRTCASYCLNAILLNKRNAFIETGTLLIIKNKREKKESKMGRGLERMHICMHVCVYEVNCNVEVYGRGQGCTITMAGWGGRGSECVCMRNKYAGTGVVYDTTNETKPRVCGGVVRRDNEHTGGERDHEKGRCCDDDDDRISKTIEQRERKMEINPKPSPQYQLRLH